MGIPGIGVIPDSGRSRFNLAASFGGPLDEVGEGIVLGRVIRDEVGDQLHAPGKILPRQSREVRLQDMEGLATRCPDDDGMRPEVGQGGKFGHCSTVAVVGSNFTALMNSMSTRSWAPSFTS